MIRLIIILLCGYALFMFIRYVSRLITVKINVEKKPPNFYKEETPSTKIDKVRETDFTELDSKLHENNREEDK